MHSSVIFSTRFAVIIASGIVMDIFWRRLPNWIFLAFVGLFVIACWHYQIGWDVWKYNLMACAAVMLFGFVQFAVLGAGIIGAGDVKFAAGMSLWFGWNEVLLEFFIIACILNGFLTVIVLVLKYWTSTYGLPPWPWLLTLRDWVVPIITAPEDETPSRTSGKMPARQVLRKTNPSGKRMTLSLKRRRTRSLPVLLRSRGLSSTGPLPRHPKKPLQRVFRKSATPGKRLGLSLKRSGRKAIPLTRQTRERNSLLIPPGP
ncbi:MAG: prepilin peptidase, partial [Methylobacteriaceae bacterium]|nr:prepilin peptidase [Methylobacteriaceae bacterium]